MYIVAAILVHKVYEQIAVSSKETHTISGFFLHVYFVFSIIYGIFYF